MFKKGSFEVGGTIYPVAIKVLQSQPTQMLSVYHRSTHLLNDNVSILQYDSRFADCFWNSSKYSMLTHIAMLLTSWAIVVDIWYLPPETQREGETSIAYANRIKALIAKQGGLVDLEW